MAAFGLAQALRGGRGPAAAAAAMELGRRKLFRAPLQGLQGMATRSMASGTGTEAAGGNGTGRSGAGMGPARSWGGCTGGCGKEIMDLRAEMMDRNQRLWTPVLNLSRENVDVCAEIMKNYERENMRALKAMSGVVATAFAGCLGTLGYSWQKSKESKESAEFDQPQKELVHKDGCGAVAIPSNDKHGSGAVAELPKEEDRGGAVAKLPKEEDRGGAVAKLAVQEDGGVAVAKPPK